MPPNVAGLDNTKPHLPSGGGIAGRRNALAPSAGNANTIRLTEGSGVTIAFAEVGNELQFTITAGAPGGLTSTASASVGGTPNITVNPGFVPRLGFHMQNNGFDHAGGFFAGTAAALQHGWSVTITPFSAGASAIFGAVGNYGWACTSFISTNVTLTGPVVSQAEMFVLGGT